MLQRILITVIDHWYTRLLTEDLTPEARFAIEQCIHELQWIMRMDLEEYLQTIGEKYPDMLASLLKERGIGIEKLFGSTGAPSDPSQS